MVPAGGSNDNILESAEEWYAQVAAHAGDGHGAGGLDGLAGEPGGAGLPAHLRGGNVV
jgi:hypothetical protein